MLLIFDSENLFCFIQYRLPRGRCNHLLISPAFHKISTVSTGGESIRSCPMFCSPGRKFRATSLLSGMVVGTSYLNLTIFLKLILRAHMVVGL